jgi:hypothetical protein
VFNLGTSEIIILFILFSPVALGAGLWIWASRREKRRRAAQGSTPPR